MTTVGDQVLLDASPQRAAEMMTRLARAARDFPRGKSARRLRRLINAYPDRLAATALTVARETGEPVTGILARTIRRLSDCALARRVAEGLGEPAPEMLPLGIACWTVIVNASLADDGAEAADDVAELVVWLNRAGRQSAAIALIRRTLAQLRRKGLPLPLDLMCQWAGMLAAIGQLEEAERRLQQILAVANAQGVERLTMVEEWINLANVRHGLGDQHGALEASRHTLHLLLRERGTDDDKSHLLSGALGNHAVYLLETGRPRAAAAAIRHVLTMVERQANRDPDRYRPDLIDALINASAIFGAIGDMDEARACSARAVAHGEKLSPMASPAHGESLVRSLINHAIDQQNRGDAGFAMEQVRTALSLARTLRHRHGDRFLEAEIDTCIALCHTGLHCEYPSEAREAGEAALALTTNLAPAMADMKRLEILPNLADALASLGGNTEALRLSAQAYALLTATEAEADVELSIRTGIRDGYARLLAENGEVQNAIAIIREAADIAHQTASRGLVSNVLIHSLVHQSGILTDLGDLDGALDTAHNAVDQARALAKHSPDWAAHELPDALQALGRAHWLRGEFPQAAALAGEMVALARQGVAIDERSNLNELASALEFSALLSNASGDPRKATDEIEEAMDAYRRLVKYGVHHEDLANGLHNAATIALAAGDVESAIRLQQEGCDVLAPIAATSLDLMRLEIEGLSNLTIYLVMVERLQDGLDAIHRARLRAAALPADWLPGQQAAIGVQVAESRLLVQVGRPAEAVARCDAALADMEACDFDFWRGPALNARAMALAAQGADTAVAAARQTFAFHLALLKTEGQDQDVHGLCDAGAVLVDVDPDSSDHVAASVRPWLQRLPPARQGSATGELRRALPSLFS
ncbi:MAG: hypothetical protein HQL42_20130 [Alphaproteobacteria bacterium]|nr:hypothetical protein [Alphaproteobacteria bacterium]